MTQSICTPIFYKTYKRLMPRRRQKRTDTQNSDDYEEQNKLDKVVHFGTVRFNRMLAPDQIEGDDSSRYSTLAWSNTLQAQRLLPWPERKTLFRRAISCLPYSYKIWQMYLSQFVDFCSSRSLQSKEWMQLNTNFEQALTKLPKMPRIWLMYAQSLQKQQLVSRAREVYNWSFRNLPLTQHQKIWSKFCTWAMKLDNSSTALKIIPRYLKLNPDFKEIFAQYLIERQLYDRAVAVIQAILDDNGYHSKAAKDKKTFYFDLINLITQHPDKITCVDGYKVIRNALTSYPQDAGKIWVKLSDYFVRLGQFDRARQILQQAIEAVDNAKDFGIIFSAYVKFEEQMITALADTQIRSQYQVVQKDNVDYQIEVRLQRLQNLLKKQPFLLHTIAIRKNPNQIQPWLGLIRLHLNAGDSQEALNVIQRAIKSINPELAQGKLSQIWIEYSHILQSSKELRRCNEVLHQATQVNFKMNEDSFAIWRRWAELLIEQHYYEDALRVVKQVLFKRRSDHDSKLKYTDDSLKNHVTLWQLYIDLQINLGTFESVKTAFERCKEHRSLTPIMLLNFANFLWDSAYFEQTFRVFEFALSNFKWPSLHQIWLAYINKFITRHGSTAIGVERGRSMFERLLKDVPKEHASIFYFMYAEFEEQYGLYSHAVEIYDRMVRAVPAQERFQAYSIYITKVAKLLGITKTRPVFEHALRNLGAKQLLLIGRKYAELQTNLGQIQRARGVFGHISQFTDPRDDVDGLWKQWQKFQVEYGDKESYKEYLRIKRSVEAKFAMLPPDLDKIEAQVKKGLAEQ